MKEQRPAVFFDRDGVLNVDHGYTYRIQDFQWITGAVAAIKFFNDHGYLVFVITNQSGVARGYYSEQDVKILHNFMNEELQKHDAHIDAFYYCPHHLEGEVSQYQKACTCRKPKPGMILQAAKEWKIDLGISLLIGDRPSDLAVAAGAGVRGHLFTADDLFQFINEQVLPVSNIKIE